MKTFPVWHKITFTLYLLLTCTLVANAQCPGGCTVVPNTIQPGGNPYTVPVGVTSICIPASGNYNVDFGSRDNVTLCIAPLQNVDLTLNLGNGTGNRINNYAASTTVRAAAGASATLTFDDFTYNNQTLAGFTPANTTFVNSVSIVRQGRLINSLNASIRVNGNLENRGDGPNRGIDNQGELIVLFNYSQTSSNAVTYTSGPFRVEGIVLPGIGYAGGNVDIQGGVFEIVGNDLIVGNSYSQSGNSRVIGGSSFDNCGNVRIIFPSPGSGNSSIGGNSRFGSLDAGTTTFLNMCDDGPISNFGFNTVNGNPDFLRAGACDCNRALPVDLIYFRAAYTDGKVNLNWATASEKDNDFFSVERSADGTNFTEIARVDGAGNSSRLLTYQAVDANPLEGVSYYRLKQTDFDGKFSYSRVQVVNAGVSSGTARVFPNPASLQDGERGFVQVAVANGERGDTFVTIFDQLGRQCFSARYGTDNALPSIRVNEFARSTGLYVIQARRGNTIVREKLLVQ